MVHIRGINFSLCIIWTRVKMGKDRFISVRKCRDDSEKIEVILRDESWQPYFKGTANLKSPREMKQLVEDLRNKGVTFPSGWL